MNSFDQVVDRRGTGSLKWDKYAGRDVLPLWVADMDFQAAPPILSALRDRVEHGILGYTVPYAEVIESVRTYLSARHGLTIEPDWIVWLPGLVPGLNLCCRAFGQSGDAVLTCTPVYPPFLSAPIFSDRRRIVVPLALEGDTWRLDWDALERAVTPETRLFILCNPHNPVGSVWSRADLERLVEFCARHNLVLCSDEIHCDLILDDVPHISTLTLGGEAARRTIAFFSPSKTYNLPGLSCAYAVIPDAALRDRFKRTARGLVTEINAFGYAGCDAAYRHGEPWRKELIDYLRVNRDLVFETVRTRMPGLVMRPMQATYLAWLDARGLSCESPTRFFEVAGVGLSNGEDFGAPGFVRLNFGCPRSVLVEGLTRMQRAIAAG